MRQREISIRFVVVVVVVRLVPLSYAIYVRCGHAFHFRMEEQDDDDDFIILAPTRPVAKDQVKPQPSSI